MKSFLVVACLLACATCFSQTFRAKYPLGERQYFPVNKDTIELTGNIRYIKVDGKVYEIKRSTAIEEAKPGWPIFPGTLPSFRMDSIGGNYFGSGTIVTPTPYIMRNL